MHDVFPNESKVPVQEITRMKAILEEFKQSEWFREGAFKKHCMLDID